MTLDHANSRLRIRREKNKYLEGRIKWLTFLLGNELFIFYLTYIIYFILKNTSLENCSREKGTEKSTRKEKKGHKEKEKCEWEMHQRMAMWRNVKTEKSAKGFVK